MAVAVRGTGVAVVVKRGVAVVVVVAVRGIVVPVVVKRRCYGCGCQR